MSMNVFGVLGGVFVAVLVLASVAGQSPGPALVIALFPVAVGLVGVAAGRVGARLSRKGQE